MNEKGIGKIIIIVIITTILIMGIAISLLFQKDGEVYEKNNIDEKSNEVLIVPTMQDEIKTNSAWCPTFQLVWNDMQNNLVDGNVEFETPISMVDNLNLQSFKEENISEEYYYKKWGLMNLDLKKDIEKGIKDKFNETSNILDLFDWKGKNNETYFFYSMLRRDFEFKNEFEILENRNFKEIENIDYFGIKQNGKELVRKQVNVLYYDNNESFAVLLETKNGDEVILARNTKGKNFEEIYENINKRTDKFSGNREFAGVDTLSIPNLNMDLLREYNELTGKYFALKDGEQAMIEKAVQTIKMKLDNKGGSIKSEAAMSVTKSAANIFPEEPRNFNFDNDFVIFLREANKELPYFAAQISDINLFLQN